MFSTIILAAGLGKRMQMPDRPKVMAELKNNPLIYYVLKATLELKPEKTVLIVGHKKEIVIDYIQNVFKKQHISDKNKSEICFVTQEEQLGTGHAALCAKNEFENYIGKVLILAGDTPLLTSDTLRSFMLNHDSTGADISVLSSTTAEPTGYGRIIRDRDENFIKIVEEKDASEEEKSIKEINSGVYLLSAEILFNLLEKIENKNNQNEYYLTDIVSIAMNEKLKIVAANIANFEEIQGINTQEQLLEVKRILEERESIKN